MMNTNREKKAARDLESSDRPVAGTFAERLSKKAWRLDSGELQARARCKTGLEDFGSPPIDPALAILTRSLDTEADLHPLGRFLMKCHLSELLADRLRVARQLKVAIGEPTDTSALPPIFVTGMPRSGSTFLHELLVQDSWLRAPRVWEVMSAASATQPERRRFDLRVWRTALCLWVFRRLAPQADAVYPMRARTPHECVAIQSYTFLSEEFVSTCRIPTYEAFLRSTDLRPAYAWQKRFLQLLETGRPPARWVLKSPDHVRGLDALFSVFPDALIVQTHRDPLDSLRSAIQLTEVLQGLYARPYERNRVAERESQNLAWCVENVIRFREKHPELAQRFVDVNYSELAADPLRIVQRIFRHFDLPLSANSMDRMQKLARSRSAYKGRSTAPTLVEVGLNPPVHRKLFGEYCRQFGIASVPAAANWRQR
jgi:hypothetical protein